MQIINKKVTIIQVVGALFMVSYVNSWLKGENKGNFLRSTRSLVPGIWRGLIAKVYNTPLRLYSRTDSLVVGSGKECSGKG